MGGGLSVLTAMSEYDLPSMPGRCKHRFCELWGPNVFHCCDCRETVKDVDVIKEEDSAIDAIVDASSPEDGINRGVTIQFLVDFATACNCWDMTTRDVRRRFIMPPTRATRCRFVDLPEMSGVVGKATTYVSHSWAAKFGDLVAALCDGNADRSRVVWVDIFAVRQWPSRKPDLNVVAVVRQCKSFVVVCTAVEEEIQYARKSYMMPPDIRAQIAFLRVWCLVEIYAAVASGATIVMKMGNYRRTGSGIEYVSDYSTVPMLFFFADVTTAEATIPEDRDRLLNEFNTTDSGLAAVNEAVRSVMTGSVCTQGAVQSAACGDAQALNTILASPSAFIISAASCGYVNVLKKLIDSGGDVNASDSEFTCMGAAATYGRTQCVALLLQSGCSVAHRDGKQQTALMLACMAGNTDIALLLIEKGSDVNAANQDGMTALLFAAMSGHAACTDLLVKRNADLEATCSGVTPLIAAAMSGHLECVHILLRAGSNWHKLDNDHCTALIHARNGGHVACVELLESCEAGNIDL